jgi:hypothetical protein
VQHVRPHPQTNATYRYTTYHHDKPADDWTHITSPNQASNRPRTAHKQTHTTVARAGYDTTSTSATVRHRAASGAREPARKRETDGVCDGMRPQGVGQHSGGVAAAYCCTFNTINDLILFAITAKVNQNAPVRFAMTVSLHVHATVQCAILLQSNDSAGITSSQQEPIIYARTHSVTA